MWKPWAVGSSEIDCKRSQRPPSMPLHFKDPCEAQRTSSRQRDPQGQTQPHYTTQHTQQTTHTPLHTTQRIHHTTPHKEGQPQCKRTITSWVRYIGRHAARHVALSALPTRSITSHPITSHHITSCRSLHGVFHSFLSVSLVMWTKPISHSRDDMSLRDR